MKNSIIVTTSVFLVAALTVTACSQEKISDTTLRAKTITETQIKEVAAPKLNNAVLQDLAAVAISVSNLEQAQKFYLGALGMTVVRTESTKDYDEAILATGNLMGAKLVLFQSHIISEPVSSRVVFYTKQGDTIMQKFKDAGLEIVREFAPIAEGIPIKIGIAKDADGNTLEFIQRG